MAPSLPAPNTTREAGNNYSRIQKIPRALAGTFTQVFVPQTEAECQRLFRLPGQLTDEMGSSKSHPLASLVEFIGLLTGKYEDGHVPELEEGGIMRD